MKVLCIFVSVVVAIKAGYHEEVGIPLAARIKEYEDNIMSEVPSMESRVVGGEVAPVGAHPYLVGLVIELKIGLSSACGSSLITATRLLTAAHCMGGVKSIEAVLGSPYLFHGGTRINTKVFATHPRFDLSRSTDHDVAIVYLPRPVHFSAIVHPIRLPTNKKEAEVVGEWAMTAGWGQTSDDASLSEETKLYQVRIKIIPAAECQKTYASSLVPGSNICTSGEGRKGTCEGDSGGPLIVERNGRKLLVGITSFGAVSCEAGAPSAFTRVASYLGFIHKHLK